MKPVSQKALRWLLSLIFMAVGFLPLLAQANPIQSFNISGQAQYFLSNTNDNNPVSVSFMGTMGVDPSGQDQNFGSIGQVTSISFEFPDLSSIPTFNTIVTQGPLVAQIDQPLAYSIGLQNTNGETATFSFITPHSSATFFGTEPIGSLVDFNGGSIFQGQTGSVSTAGGSIFLQNFSGSIDSITPSPITSMPEPATLEMFSLGLLLISTFIGLRPSAKANYLSDRKGE
ncbi:hypothetical protein TAO_0893 [Candidatus Nitrosoglobus terrae]|uniref:PEP-CTERM protein-sorting domain-containing protein n=1 Tax=Candidatus Nitrosoglobus terrae TaxID=1630141 RepID=A0A1Q2SMC5_9GAMM|nr:hypothetical protein [Candidatus Nitrosoglobus terrae]BAW80263.1 hypothetical protein TAO_0893 [Candidatus Nitrosoglobus terrae]